MASDGDDTVMDDCPICKGARWVCVTHHASSWDEGCTVADCHAEGMHCVCNPTSEMPPGTEIIESAPVITWKWERKNPRKRSGWELLTWRMTDTTADHALRNGAELRKVEGSREERRDVGGKYGNPRPGYVE